MQEVFHGPSLQYCRRHLQGHPSVRSSSTCVASDTFVSRTNPRMSSGCQCQRVIPHTMALGQYVTGSPCVAQASRCTLPASKPGPSTRSEACCNNLSNSAYASARCTIDLSARNRSQYLTDARFGFGNRAGMARFLLYPTAPQDLCSRRYCFAFARCYFLCLCLL